jgi:site-specific DNA-cytosine methylase
VDTYDQQISCISLFSGYGGLDLGVRRIIPNLRVVAYVEIEAYAIELLAQKISRGEMDEAPIFTDVTQFPSEEFRDKVHLVIAGYPCQDFSSAGNRAGLEGNRGKMWGYTRAVVNGCNARAFFGENVDGHVSLGLDTVISDLVEDGFVVKGGIYSAFEVGAPHLRKRVFSLSFRSDPRLPPWSSAREGNQGWLDIDELKFRALTTGFLGNPEHDGLSTKSELRSDEGSSHEWSQEESEEAEQSEGTDRPRDAEGIRGGEQRSQSAMGYPLNDGHSPTAESRETEGSQKEGGLQESEGGSCSTRPVADNESERRRLRTDESRSDARRIQNEEGEVGRSVRSETGGGSGSYGELADTHSIGLSGDGVFEELGEEKGREGTAGYKPTQTFADCSTTEEEACLALARVLDEGYPSTYIENGEQRIRFEPEFPIRWPARPGKPQYIWEQPRTYVGDSSGKGLEGSTGESLQGGESGLASTDGGDAEEEIEPELGGEPNAVTHGLHEHRIERLRLLGNGVVWLTASKAFSELLTLHKEDFDYHDKIQNCS